MRFPYLRDHLAGKTSKIPTRDQRVWLGEALWRGFRYWPKKASKEGVPSFMYPTRNRKNSCRFGLLQLVCVLLLLLLLLFDEKEYKR